MLLDYVNFAFMCSDKPPSKGLKVAVIGSGPAGLSAAGYLACHGYEVDVYDKQPLPGGLMIFAIPPWRIPRSRILDGVKLLEERFGIVFHYKTKVFEGGMKIEEGDEFIEKTVSLEEVLTNYHAVLIATGTWESKIPRLPGVDSKGVFSALEFLYRHRVYEIGLSSHPPPVGKKVVVVGGGYSAIDAAEQAARFGGDVVIAYRRTVREAPAGLFEIERLKREGVEFMELVSPIEVVVDNGTAKGLKLQKMKLGPPDETGRPQPVPIEGSTLIIEADTVIFATGEVPTPPLSKSEDIVKKLGIALKKDSSIQVNRINQTGNPKIFAAGDVVNGPTRIGPAVRSGLYTARFIDNWLQTQLLKTPLTAR
ncbi:FAD-dependent oxidoreductase [Thermogladius sp. 4427co]|uniref:FAD-dependent oxidoreductase n=1 Tax=Thermogladius sp. 4427co TaxID=3450718 RepID=UPI003F797DD5